MLAIAAQYQEAPILAEKVAAGELPAVEERLPENPYVQKVVEEIGQYGGDWRRAWKGVSDKWGPAKLGEEFFMRFLPDGSGLEPNLAAGMDVLEDSKVFVFTLRKGVKWSDGEAFDVDDVMFHWEHIVQNEDIFGSFPWWLTGPNNGEPATIEKIDQYSFKVSFSEPFTRFPEMFTYEGKEFYVPAHWFSTILPEFVGTEKTEQIASEKGYANAKDYINWRRKYYWIFPEVPSLRAWVPTNEPSEQRFIMERNPYYWKVDAEGNQLPYIDRIVHDFIEDKEVINLKAMSGELDFQGRHIAFENYPLFAENAEKGEYRIVKFINSNGATVPLAPNPTCKDEVLAELFRDVRFRRALSLAIDRDEINEITQLGLAEPRQASIVTGGPYFSEEWEKAYIEYDPEQATALLEEMGLKKDSDGKYFLRPDGETLAVVVETYQEELGTALELITATWEAVGIKTAVKIEERSLWEARRETNDFEIAVNPSFDAYDFLMDPLQMIPIRYHLPAFGLYGKWIETDGAEGVEPPAEIARLLELWNVIMAAQTQEERDAAANEIVKLHTENLWTIGTVGEVPAIHIVKNNLRNVPEGLVSSDVMRTPGNAEPWQFFFKN
jgi:peptide/nickel transport system substrate-binding protein